MSAMELRKGVWSVGVLNPSLRVFDIVMESKYGTSYNAYLLTGEKNVLIETVHTDYFEEYVENIEQVLPLERVDYLIMNHNEPDHSGSVSKLLERCPGLKIFCTAAGKKYLEDITNRTFPVQVVKAGDTLDLGGKTLEFIPAPMLHWADSMFTWDPADKVVFTCDFLGAHFCEPTMLDSRVHAREAYAKERHFYYQCIFGPFAPYVQAGLGKLPAEAEMACTSHGPVLTETLEECKALYRQWSTPVPREGNTAAIIYASAYGCTRALAQAAAEALEEMGIHTVQHDVTMESLDACAAIANEADVVLVGSATINRDAPKAVWDVLGSIDAINTKGRAAGAFGAYGWSGEAPGMLQTRLGQLKFATPAEPFRVLFTPTAADLDGMKDYARSVAALLK
ncbi:MAG: FprA family A-type flavoprotein [Clostridiales bacterium]|nr:FprA family A-type flavoprotein [Clostridiales bacterium]